MPGPLTGEPQPVQRRLNVILFGNTGAATRHSVVNLISGFDHVVEQPFPLLPPSSLDAKRYKVTIQGRDFRIFDSPLERLQALRSPDRLIVAIGKAYRLIRLLSGTGGVNLLVLCMQDNIITSDIQNDYRLFHHFLCQQNVPVVLLVNRLERAQGKLPLIPFLTRNGIRTAGHACITTRRDFTDLHHLSRQAVYNLLIAHGCAVAFTQDKIDWVTEMFTEALDFLGFRPRPNFFRGAEERLLEYGLKEYDMAKILEKICQVDTKTTVPGPPGGLPRGQGRTLTTTASFTPNSDHGGDSLNDLGSQVIKESNRPVASGGFADIYRGILELPRTAVAIKAIRIYSEDNDLEKKKKRLRRELKVWQRLKHDNILPLLGTISGVGLFPDMVCPWAENGALTSYLSNRYNNLSVVEILRLLGDVSCGLEYLHSCSVVHSDLSGSNILICEDGRACITDFGLSTLLTELGGPTFNTSFRERGSIRWMAPELLDLRVPENELEEEASPVLPTTCSDVYSFGSIMLQILTGKVPYHNYTRDVQVVSAISKGIKPMRPSVPLVTEGRWMFIERCWSTVDVRTRPSGKEIVEFTKNELADVSASES